MGITFFIATQSKKVNFERNFYQLFDGFDRNASLQ